VSVEMFNEFEVVASVSTTIPTGVPVPLSSLSPAFEHAQLGSDFAYTRVRGAAADSPGIMMTAITQLAVPAGSAHAIVNVVADGTSPPRQILLPFE